MARLFNLKAGTYRRIRAGYVPLAPEDPYAILGLAPDASDEDVRRARRLQLADVHPDRVRARGLPSEFESLYTQKSALINQAFDLIAVERALA